MTDSAPSAPRDAEATGPAAGDRPASGPVRTPDALRSRAAITRLSVAALAALAVIVVLVTNSWLTTRFSETTRNRAEVRLALYSGNLLSELQRNSVVPLLLSRDPELLSALAEGSYASTSQRLISYQTEIGAASILLLDREGRAVGATNRNTLGSAHRSDPYFVNAQRAIDTVFTAAPRETGGVDFTYSRAMILDNKLVGVIVVAVDLMKYERAWSGLTDAVLVTDSTGKVILATEPRWRGLSVDQALSVQDPPSAIQRAIQATSDWTLDRPDAYLRGQAVMKTEARVPFRGWRIVTFTAYDSVRERVNGVLALEIMGFAILLTIAFYVLSRQAWSQSMTFQRESAELRLLNARLQREIAQREKVQKDLAVAELTLAQSSKLAALGEMSAAVSHELNQPLAAMKTYLAGARLLLQRRRPDEALSSFQRIDDLIERMGAITRQLKSYARKGGEAFEPVDVRACLSSALSMMEPQLKVRVVRITRTLPRSPVIVMADRLRLGAGHHQPASQRARRDQGRGPSRDRAFAGRRRPGAPVGQGQRPRHREPRRPVRAVLHNEEAGRGGGARARHILGHRDRPRRQADGA